MRKLIVILPVLALLAFSNAYSQAVSAAPSQGGKALLFEFSGLSNLGANAYEGGIGGKYFLSDQTALRVMLLFGMSNHNNASGNGTKDDSVQFGLSAGLEYHFPISTSVSPYVGGGIYAASGDIKNSNFHGVTKGTYTTLGVGVAAGVEYFFNKNISLAGEYQFGLSATNSTGTGVPSQQDLTLGFQTADLTLGVYF
jgi:opacity protein-like surface antigen